MNQDPVPDVTTEPHPGTPPTIPQDVALIPAAPSIELPDEQFEVVDPAIGLVDPRTIPETEPLPLTEEETPLEVTQLPELGG